MTSRRHFIQLMPLGAAALLAARTASAEMLDPTSAQAVALGYVADSAKADKAKYPKHTADQSCASCQLFQAKAGDATGGCPLFPGKQVTNKGWCSAYVKKT
jgi:hypothetical protein